MPSMTQPAPRVKPRRSRIDFSDGRVNVAIRDALGFVNDCRSVWAVLKDEAGLPAVARLKKNAARRLLRAQRSFGVKTFPVFLGDDNDLLLGK